MPDSCMGGTTSLEIATLFILLVTCIIDEPTNKLKLAKSSRLIV